MRRIYGAALSCALGLCACGGGSVNTSTSSPATSVVPAVAASAAAVPAGTAAAAADASARSGASLKSRFIAVLYPNHVSVYDRSARGTGTPIATNALSFTASAIAVDRENDLYVADGKSWTVYKYSSPRSATPAATYAVTDPSPDASLFNDSIAAIGVRYDGGIAALLVRTPKAGGASQYSFGIITPGSGVPGIVKQLTTSVSGGSVMVDGSGDVLIETIVNVPYLAGTIQPIAVERFSPHPDGFYDDGIIYQNWLTAVTMDVANSEYEAWAASGTDEMFARYVLYPTTNDTGFFSPVAPAGVNPGPAESGVQLSCPTPIGMQLYAAFDGNDRLYVVQGLIFARNGVYTYGLCIYPRKPTAATQPETLTLSESTLPIGLAVSQ